jgi:hypothetical protein
LNMATGRDKKKRQRKIFLTREGTIIVPFQSFNGP